MVAGRDVQPGEGQFVLSATCFLLHGVDSTMTVDGEPNHFQFGISRSTGRFSLAEMRGTTSRVCHGIE